MSEQKWRPILLMPGLVMGEGPGLDVLSNDRDISLWKVLSGLSGRQVRVTLEVPYQDEDYLREIDKLHRERDGLDAHIEALRAKVGPR